MLMGQTIRRLEASGMPLPALHPFPQGAARLEADKGLLDLIEQRRIAHDGDATLRAHLDNANRKQDADGRRLRIVKRRQSQKIDLAVALSMACARWTQRGHTPVVRAAPKSNPWKGI
jgi:phage terminase large subunit-like protein